MSLNKNAIFMLLFNDKSYVVPACASAYLHKKFINKLKLNIDLIIMTDDAMYKFKNELLRYFDDVKLIDMSELKLKLHESYKYASKYSSNMEYFTNKFHILKYEEYNTILFLDIDVLPCADEFYTVFNTNAPAFVIKFHTNNFNSVITDDVISYKKHFDDSQYHNASQSLKNSIDASLMLVKPSIEIFNNYKLFLKICEHTDGYISADGYVYVDNIKSSEKTFGNSGPDETTIILFYMFYKNIKCSLIPYDFCAAPMKFRGRGGYKNVYSINYRSSTKPWTKLDFMRWSEDYVWHDLIKKITIKSEVLKNIYEECLIHNLLKNFEKIKKELKSSLFNNMRMYTKKLIKYVKNNHGNLDKNKVFELSKRISLKMKPYPDFKYDKYIYQIIEQGGGNIDLFENKLKKYLLRLEKYIFCNEQ